MVRIALAVTISREDLLSSALARHGYEVVARCDNAVELASQLQLSGAEIALVSADSRFLTDRLMAEADAVGVRLIALADSEDGRQFASSLGLYEVVAPDAGWDDLEAMIAPGPRVQPHHFSEPGSSDKDQPETGRGEVIAVWGPAGAPGRTTLAINLAAELAASGFTVALADVDTHSASVAPMLGMLDEAPGFAAACRLAGTDGLNLEQLERIAQRYISAHGNFWVLTGIGRASRWPELSAERVVKTLSECRHWVDYTVVDTGSSLENDEEISSDMFAPRRNAATVAALRQADQVVAVGSADPVGLSRFLRAHVDLVETLVTDRVTVVMNKLRSGAIGSGAPAQVKHSLERFGGIVSPVLIAHDQAALDSAVLGGKTLHDTAPKSAVCDAIRELTALLLPEHPDTSRKRRGWLRRGTLTR